MREAEEAQGIMDTSDPNSIQEAMQSIEDMKSERGYYQQGDAAKRAAASSDGDDDKDDDKDSE